MIIVRKIQIPSLPTKKPRRLYVYLPKEYGKTDRRYPVLYMFDGHNVFYNSHATYGKSWGMKEYLEKTKMPLIVVGIECNPEDFKRLSEYSPWTFTRRGLPIIEGKGKETMDWITGTLKPEIDRTYRTLPDRENTMIAGSSMGGLIWASHSRSQSISPRRARTWICALCRTQCTAKRTGKNGFRSSSIICSTTDDYKPLAVQCKGLLLFSLLAAAGAGGTILTAGRAFALTPDQPKNGGADSGDQEPDQ